MNNKYDKETAIKKLKQVTTKGYFGTVVIDTSEEPYSSYESRSHKWNMEELIKALNTESGKYRIGIQNGKICSVHVEQKLF